MTLLRRWRKREATSLNSTSLRSTPPPANKRATKMSFEDDTWPESQKKVMRGAKPPRWRRSIHDPRDAIITISGGIKRRWTSAGRGSW